MNTRIDHRRRRLRPAAALVALGLLLAGCGGADRDARSAGIIEQTAVGQQAPAVPGAGGDAPQGRMVDARELPERARVPNAATTEGVPWTPGQWSPPPEGDRPVGVWIPVIEVWAQLGGLGLEEDGTLEVPSDYGATGWYVNGPRPGETGPAVVAGHVDSRDGPAVFFRLRQLEADDLVHIVYASGYVATFRIAQLEQYGKDDFPTQRVYGDVDAPELRLITCGGAFDRSSGHYRANLVGYAAMFASWHYDPQSGAV